MPLLFSYGTLQLPEIQLATFGRPLSGSKDALVGYEPSLGRIADPAIAERLQKTHHNNVVPSPDVNCRVDGTAFEVSDAELLEADVYEAEFDYKRIVVKLGSGRESWLYVHEADR